MELGLDKRATKCYCYNNIKCKCGSLHFVSLPKNVNNRRLAFLLPILKSRIAVAIITLEFRFVNLEF